ncbi:hypothetical protein ACSSS7_007244 [Eimeria intestinalis]
MKNKPLYFQGLEEAVAGTSVFVVEDESQLAEIEEEVMTDIGSVFKNVDHSGNGVYVMASTLGALEALLVYLQECKIPVFAVNIGSVQKRDVRKASIMREKGRPELSVILAFNVKVDGEAEKEAKVLGVRIMTAEIIYHLFDEFTAYFNQVKQEKKSEHKHFTYSSSSSSNKTGESARKQQKEVQQEVVFPCILSVLPQFIFNKKDPIVVGVLVEEGFLKVGTPLCVPEKGVRRERDILLLLLLVVVLMLLLMLLLLLLLLMLLSSLRSGLKNLSDLRIGTVVSVELNRKPVEKAVAGSEVCIKVVGEPSIMVGRHFEAKNKLVSRLTRNAIDCLKEHFRDELSKVSTSSDKNLRATYLCCCCCCLAAAPGASGFAAAVLLLLLLLASLLLSCCCYCFWLCCYPICVSSCYECCSLCLLDTSDICCLSCCCVTVRLLMLRVLLLLLLSPPFSQQAVSPCLLAFAAAAAAAAAAARALARAAATAAGDLDGLRGCLCDASPRVYLGTPFVAADASSSSISSSSSQQQARPAAATAAGAVLFEGGALDSQPPPLLANVAPFR